MMRAGLLLALVSVPAAAQVSYPPLAIDTSAFASKTDIPARCSTVPAPDSYQGSVGSAAACIPAADAARATQVKSVPTVTASDGSFSILWADKSGAASPFPSEPASVWATIYGQKSPIICMTITKSATGATGQCSAIAPITLPGTLTAMQNLVLSTFQNAAAGLSITVNGRQ